MKVVVVGSDGRMGQKVCKVLTEMGDEVLKLDIGDKIRWKSAEIIIDFSTSDDRTKIVEYADRKKIPYACFATGISEKDEKLLQKLAQNVPVLLCKNSSRGMIVMMEAAKLAAGVLNSADIVLQEYHHKGKKDSPGGTAKQILEVLKRQDVCVHAFRVGNEVGTHKIQFFLEDEVFEISHKVNSRDVFAKGAVEMAKKLQGKEAGIYKKLC